MSEYSKSQSTVIALWVLALQSRHNGDEFARKGPTAPPAITDLVNQHGEPHTSDSILLHTHGYDRLLLGRTIGKTITNLQREIASEFHSQGIVRQLFEA
jgi:hypothetical protein